MVLFKINGKLGTYPGVVLDGRNFYLKAQEMIFGSNSFKSYETIKEDTKDLKIEVIEIDTKKEDINKKLANLYNKDNSVGYFIPLNQSTIDKHYQKMYSDQNFDFYQNLCNTYNKKTLKKLVEFVLYRNLTPSWVSIYFNIEVDEVLFILENLPIYYNYLFEEE